MATRKKYTEHDAYEEFISVLTRSKFTFYTMNDNILICKKNDKSGIFNLGDRLNTLIRIDPIYQEKMTEFQVNDENLKLINIAKLGDDGWIELDANKLYQGEMIDIPVNIDKNELVISINKGVFPCRLLKKEFRDIYYRVDLKGIPSLILKKVFKNKLEGFEFTLYQAFQIV